MKQTFKVIPVEDYGVVVDENKNPEYGSWVTDGVTVYLITENRWKLFQTEEQAAHLRSKVQVIIATIGKRLDSVPLIKLADEVETLAVKAIPKSYPMGRGMIKRRGFIEGYKANPNKYSEEDIRKAIELARESYRPMGNGDEQYINDEDSIIKSLQKKRIPVSVELEMMRNGAGQMDRYAIKITNTETNTITPLTVIHEYY